MSPPPARRLKVMTTRTPRETVNLAELYHEDLMPWSRAQEALGTGPLGADRACFLGTVRPDGRPHAAGIGVVADAGAGELYFTSGPGARKARNLAANPACTIALRLDGIDLTLEGEARRVTDAATIERIAARYRDGGWPAQSAGDAITAEYSAQSAGPPPWHLYRFTILTAFGVGLRPPHGASRWRF
jgi:pyridoxine/pyridoxamine 5'-phosphate oxidase